MNFQKCIYSKHEMVQSKYFYDEYAMMNFGIELGQKDQQLRKRWWTQMNQGFGLDCNYLRHL